VPGAFAGVALTPVLRGVAVVEVEDRLRELRLVPYPGEPHDRVRAVARVPLGGEVLHHPVPELVAVPVLQPLLQPGLAGGAVRVRACRVVDIGARIAVDPEDSLQVACGWPAHTETSAGSGFERGGGNRHHPTLSTSPGQDHSSNGSSTAFPASRSGRSSGSRPG